MDFPTISMSRKESIKLGQAFRALLGYDNHSPFNPLEALERIHLVMPEVSYEIFEDTELPGNVPAVCEMDIDESFTIKIKESVYQGAYENLTGGYLMDITHEMVHPFLYRMGYKPSLLARSFENNSIPAYLSAEWQTKAVAGEVMIPYAASEGKTISEIMEEYHVSESAARHRIHLSI